MLGAEITSNGQVHISNGGILSKGGGSYGGGQVHVSSGGSYVSGTIASQGVIIIIIISGGYCMQPIITMGSTFVSGGRLFSATFRDGTVSVGGSGSTWGYLSHTVMSAGAVMNIFSGGLASETYLLSGQITVANGGKIQSTVVSSGSNNYITIMSGASAHITELQSGAKMYVSSGATATTNRVLSGGYLEIAGFAQYNSITGGDLLVSKGGTIESTTLNGGNLHIFGSANSTTVTKAVRFYVQTGAAINYTTINSGAGMDITSATASNTTVNSGGSVSMFGGTADIITVNKGGTLTVSGGGIVKKATVNGLIQIEGATASSATVSSGGRFTVSSGGSAVSAAVTGTDASMSVAFGGVADNAIVSGVRTSVSILESALATNAKVFSGGRIDVFSTGRADNAAIYSNGSMNVHSGGTANSATVQGVMDLNGTANSAKVNAGGRLNVLNGARLNNATVNKGDINLSGGTATAATVDGPSAYLTVFSGGKANSATVQGGGTMIVSANGIADSAVVSSGGSMKINDLGSATNTVVSAGRMYVSSGGSVYRATIFGNGEFTLSGGFASATSIRTGGKFIVSGGSAHYSIVSAGGSMTVYRNGKVDEISLDGILNVYGVADSTGVNTTGAIMTVYSGGVAINTTVGNGAALTVSSGGKITGRFLATAEAVVSAYAGAVVDFDISSLDPANAALLNNLSLVKGAPSFTLTVSNSQADGTYKLAGGAAGFSKTISVVNTGGTSLGTLTVGQTATIGGVNYTLNLGGDNTLSVTIGGAPGPQPVTALPFFTGDFNGDLFDTLAVQKDSTVTIYMNGEPWGLGLTLDPGWTVVGTGDFNGDKLDDFLRVNTEGYVVGEMSNGNGTFTPQVLNLKNAGWDILGTGDFNGNGTSDVLIANPTGASETVGLLGYWESGVSWTLINGYSPEWECVSTGDFNGDGKCDMLWRNSFEGEGGLTYNAYCTWIVDNPVDWRMVSVANPDEWNFLCSGDFDGNGSHDIAMINDVGVVGIWGVTDGYLSSWSILSAVTSEWQLAGVADFNGDGTDDIAWSNSNTGLTGYWQINDKQLTTWQNIAVIG
ncbi:MAG: AIDA repeat-containing protein [Lentisphaeria bacterium]|nr:AIDA repeat-containing protein [Lentisphaeria bacterium]